MDHHHQHLLLHNHQQHQHEQPHSHQQQLNHPVSPFEAQLLKKIEIAKLSSRLKSKLSAINNKINNPHESTTNRTSRDPRIYHSYSVSKLPRRSPHKRYAHYYQQSPISSNNFSKPKPSRKNFAPSILALPPSSPFSSTVSTPKTASRLNHHPAYTNTGNGANKYASPTISVAELAASIGKLTPLSSKKNYKYQSLDDMMAGTATGITKPKQQATSTASPATNYNQPPSSVLSTPKAKITRNFSSHSHNHGRAVTTPGSGNGNGNGDDEGANLLMYLATSPSPYTKAHHHSSNTSFPSSPNFNQFMSSPVRVSKSYHEFSSHNNNVNSTGNNNANSNNLSIPATPQFSKLFSSPYSYSNPHSIAHTPNTSIEHGIMPSTPSTTHATIGQNTVGKNTKHANANANAIGLTTPKMQSGSVFNSGNGNLPATVIRTPKFNMSDYVNFLSPSPCAKRGNNNTMNNINITNVNNISVNGAMKDNIDSYISNNINDIAHTNHHNNHHDISRMITPDRLLRNGNGNSGSSESRLSSIERISNSNDSIIRDRDASLNLSSRVLAKDDETDETEEEEQEQEEQEQGRPTASKFEMNINMKLREKTVVHDNHGQLMGDDNLERQENGEDETEEEEQE